MVNKPRRIFVFHPFLFAIYSVLGAYAQNSSQVPMSWIVRPLVFLILVTIIMYVCLRMIFKDSEYAGFVSTLFLNWIFIGYVYRILLNWSSFWQTFLGGFCAFLLGSLPLAFLASPWLWKRISHSRTITVFMNATSVILVLFPLWTTLGILYKGNTQIRHAKELQAQFEVSLKNTPAPAPDIYLIIVDGYGRADFLHDVYGFDNSQMVQFLRDKGFYVADRATSNYPQTQLSLSSLLNLQYLNESVKEFGATSDRSALYELVQHSLMRQLLKDQGYQFVALPSAVLTTQIRDADIFLGLEGSNINEFETFLLSSTLLGVAVESWGIDLPVMSYELHRKYVLFALEKLREVPTMPGPKFVFAHIMLPHPPFIFDRDGNFLPPDGPYVMWDASLFPGSTEEYQHGYTEQVTFLNKQLVETISDILARSATPPIIILQGDHGPGSYFNMEEPKNTCLKERYSILDAYYFPDGNYASLYPSITPINSFRVILDQYFDADLELLEDRNYYSTWSAPYVFMDVTDQSQVCKQGPED
jgi:hypothetical protein